MEFIPSWNIATLSSHRQGKRLFIWCGPCKHSVEFVKGLIETAERPYWEAKWQEECDRLFANKTARWTDAQRASFWARLGRNAENLPPRPTLNEPAH